MLLGSLACGLTVTNAVYLYYLWGRDAAHDDTVLSILLGGDAVENVTDKALLVDISHGMALLWTVGAASHSFFDLLLWHMISCGGIKSKTCQMAGWNMAVVTVMILVSVTSFVVAVRRAYEAGDEVEQDIPSTIDDQTTTIETALNFGDGLPDFQFLYSYLVGLVTSIFICTPLVQTLLFTGIRPYKVWRECKNKENDSTGDVSTDLENF